MSWNTWKKIGRSLVRECFWILLFLVLTSCATNIYRVTDRTIRYSQRIYDQSLEKYGNASMLSPSFGNCTVVWYFYNDTIKIIRIGNTKIMSQVECSCDSIIDIRKYERGCYPESLDGMGFDSSFYDEDKDSVYKISVSLDLMELKSKGSDCPVLNELRSLILKYQDDFSPY